MNGDSKPSTEAVFKPKRLFIDTHEGENAAIAEDKQKLAPENNDTAQVDAAGAGCSGDAPAAAAAARQTRPKRKAGDGTDGADSDNDSTTGLEEDEFLVERVLDYMYENGQDMFLIKWKGWAHKHNTWEPQTNLNCVEKIIDFFKHRERTNQNKRQRPDVTEEAREASVRMFEETHFTPPDDEQLNMLFSKHSVDGKLTFKNKLKPLETVHADIHDLVRRESMEASTLKALKRIQTIKEQLLQHHLLRKREHQLVRLKHWEEDLNRVCQEPTQIVVENNVDLALPPTDFVYTNDYIPGEGVEIPSDPVIGCECTKCHLSSTSCCSGKAGAQFAYTQYGKLRLDVGQPIYECNKACRCGPDCRNRVVQGGRKVKLAIFRTDNGCGWGVKALEPIKRGVFVTEYVGEVITSEEAERRGRQYDAIGMTYLFDLDFNDQMNLYTVDAAVHGNVSHFINHSCEPNLVVYGVWADCLDPNLPRLALFACRDICRGEQLFFDYNSPLGSNAAAAQLPSPDVAGNTRTAKSNTGDTPVKASDTTDTGSADTSAPDAGTPTKQAAVPLSPTKSPRRALGSHPSARVTCKCGAKTCRRYLF